MEPIIALNCLLQIEQVRSEEESSIGDALALAFRCVHSCSASLILFASIHKHITKTCLHNFDPLKPHFYIIKLRFTGVYIYFLMSTQKHRLGYSLEPHR